MLVQTETRSPRRGHVGRILTATGALVLSLVAPTSGAERLPPTFADELVAAAPEPTAIAFTPGGDMLVATKDGRVLVKPPGRRLQRRPVFDVRRTACAEGDSGRMGIAVDPLFAWNRFVYVYYTRRRSRDCRSAVNRLSRFVLAGSAPASRRSERVLLDNMPSPTGIHNAGDVQFGKDGFLYVATGDGGCHPVRGSRCGVRKSGGARAERPARQDPAHRPRRAGADRERR
jgi:glucose/arabinose dehydrogenase